MFIIFSKMFTKNILSNKLFLYFFSYILILIWSAIFSEKLIAQDIYYRDPEKTVCWNGTQQIFMHGVYVDHPVVLCDYKDVYVCPYDQWTTNFDKFMQSACKAYRENDLNTALINYRRAAQLKPNHLGVIQAIKTVEFELEELRQTKNKREFLTIILNVEYDWYKSQCYSSEQISSPNEKCKFLAKFIIETIGEEKESCLKYYETNLCAQALVASGAQPRSSFFNEQLYSLARYPTPNESRDTSEIQGFFGYIPYLGHYQPIIKEYVPEICAYSLCLYSNSLHMKVYSSYERYIQQINYFLQSPQS